jgi:hypothetical protein
MQTRPNRRCSMPRIFSIVSLLSLLATPALCDQKGIARPAPPPRAVRPPPGVPKGPKAGPRITNPASPAARLYQMSPEERERALEKVPAARQEAIRKQLEYFDSLPKEQQQIMIGRTERFANLAPEKRRAFMQQMQAVNRLPKERKQMVGQLLRRMQSMSDQQRADILNSPQFRDRFTPEEQKMIADLSEVLLPPI